VSTPSYSQFVKDVSGPTCIVHERSSVGYSLGNALMSFICIYMCCALNEFGLNEILRKSISLCSIY